MHLKESRRARMGKKRAPAGGSRWSMTAVVSKPRDGTEVRLAIATQPALLRDMLSQL
jgi:hypothetical protein